MTIPCDHRSVGILVRRAGKLLLIERRRPPFGFAPPAGHVDARPSFEEAARSELFEETGLTATSLELLAEGRRDNPCRRPGGDRHYWQVFKAEVTGELVPSTDETRGARWADQFELAHLAERTRQFQRGAIDAAEWQRQPGLEPVWLDWLTQLRIL
jgi:ADP-ribose pyrophosphatase YjhB (NUDIX family)